MAARLVAEVEQRRPDLYRAILSKIRPHRLDSVVALLDSHLRRFDLDLFNRNREAISDFVYAFVSRLKFPTPGDAFGINLTCRITKADTQGTLDSKHLRQSLTPSENRFNVEKAILDELDLFSTQLQVFELANRHRYATVYVKDTTAEELLRTIPEAGNLERGAPFNKARDALGRYRYLSTFRFVIVEGSKVLYQTSRDLLLLLRHLPMERIVAFSDVRQVFKKCGIVLHFFNMVEVTRLQLWNNEGSVYERDVLTLIKYQCRSGTPLPLTRDGLAKNPDRSPLEVLSFEAPKKNYARLSTCPATRDRWYNVETSADKIFFGQQFNEGTGYSFALMNGVK